LFLKQRFPLEIFTPIQCDTITNAKEMLSSIEMEALALFIENSQVLAQVTNSI
jgi:hypothetical protein